MVRRKAIVKAEAEEREREKDITIPDDPSVNYWQAELIGGHVVKTRPLTYSEARDCMAELNNIVCRNRAAAIGIVKFYPSAIWHERHKCKDGYLNHYHLNNGRLHAHDNHIWYYGE